MMIKSVGGMDVEMRETYKSTAHTPVVKAKVLDE
jgi:hypothetical protein